MMQFLTAAFAASTSVPTKSFDRVSNRCQLREPRFHRRRTSTPTMLNTASVVSEILAAAVLGFGTYSLVFREQPREETDPEVDEKQSAPPSQGTLGLSTSVGGTATAAAVLPQTTSFPVTPPPLDTIGVDINDFLDSGDVAVTAGQERLEEELSFASNALSDLLGCHAIVVVDAAGDVVWVEGDLVGETTKLGRLPSRVMETGRPETLNVTDNSILPFLNNDVRNAAILPIGEQGGALVVASRENDFFGQVEQRVANAVCGRLANFLRIPPVLEA